MDHSSDTIDLAVLLPVMLGVTLILGYAVHSVLRDKGLGVVGNGAFLMIGLVAGGAFMGFCQAHF
ncbi:hypothetical protein SAMN06265338_10874 [Rhodoblastus acidophilus]|uniref:Uncharacterized protein n=1 Tax=Rhodoblastus acidophilus TaxID=1074 RepID=A0A212RWJ6_RHOAC|nr:hypothetical protein [Rhodoblastus acidophilus]MCW2315197.1 hypothetical protein [Rhodoblastus acidophilus]PPQ38378.1 hypothetical protein CKO16_10295 [Rhodoblastus acidophilus]RAI20051.1 hypothetical protein CH337_10670 [Rhodoblastus acidophilus]SNB77082.1 hypothetical protein SAMN06265338_10874 [Rhodoblastus acidophilus]